MSFYFSFFFSTISKLSSTHLHSLTPSYFSFSLFLLFFLFTTPTTTSTTITFSQNLPSSTYFFTDYFPFHSFIHPSFQQRNCEVLQQSCRALPPSIQRAEWHCTHLTKPIETIRFGVLHSLGFETQQRSASQVAMACTTAPVVSP